MTEEWKGMMLYFTMYTSFFEDRGEIRMDAGTKPYIDLFNKLFQN